jgi:hypothetical protein
MKAGQWDALLDVLMVDLLVVEKETKMVVSKVEVMV